MGAISPFLPRNPFPKLRRKAKYKLFRKQRTRSLTRKLAAFDRNRSAGKKATSPGYYVRRAWQGLQGKFTEKAIRKKLRTRRRWVSGISAGMSDEAASASVEGFGEYKLVSRIEGNPVRLQPTGTPFVRVTGGVSYMGPQVITDNTPFQNRPPFQRRDIPRYVGWQTPMTRLRRGMNVQYPL